MTLGELFRASIIAGMGGIIGAGFLYLLYVLGQLAFVWLMFEHF